MRRVDERENSEAQPLFLTQEPEPYSTLLKEAIKISGGTLSMAVVQTVGPLIGNIIISRIDDQARIATLMIFSLVAVNTMVFNAPLMYLPTIAGKKIDENTPELVGSEFQVGSLMAILCSVPQIIVFSFSGKILNLLDQDNEASKITQSFFYRYMFATPFISLQMASDQISMVTKNVYPPVITYLATWTVGSTLSYLLANGYLGLPKMGINGVAIILAGRSLLQYISYTAFLFYSSNRPEGWFAPFHLFKRHTGQLNSFIKQSTNGILLLLAVGSVIGSMFFINMLAGKLGPVAASAQLVVSQYEQFMLIAGQAFGQTAQIQVSSRITTNTKSILRVCLITCSAGLVCSLMYALSAITIPRLLMTPYFDPNDKKNQDIVYILQNEKVLLISSVSTILNILSLIIGQALLGVNKMAIPLITGIIFNWLIMGLAYKFASSSLELNLFLALGDILNFTIAISYYLFENSRNFGIQTIQQTAEAMENQPIVPNSNEKVEDDPALEENTSDDRPMMLETLNNTSQKARVLSLLFRSEKEQEISSQHVLPRTPKLEVNNGCIII